MQLGDTIAPPISATRDPSDDSFFATKIILWLCVEADSEEPGKALADFVQITANDIWLDPRNRMAHCVKVHHVQHPGPVVGTSIPQALKQTEVENIHRIYSLW